MTTVIDLSHPMRPGREARRLEITRLEAAAVTGHAGDGGWYVMHSITMDNHLATHIEVPFHCLPDGADLAQVAADRLVGDAVTLDLRGHAAGEAISLSAVQRAASVTGGIRAKDIVFCMTGWSAYYGTPSYLQAPYLNPQAVRWLVGHELSVLGIDTPGAMDPSVPDRANHVPIFEAGTLYIENLCNLEAVPPSRFIAATLPPAIAGLDGFPVRVVALV